MVGLQEEIKEIEKILKEKDYALEEQKRLKEFEGQIKNIGYDEVRHRQLNRKIEELSGAPLERIKLEEAEKKKEKVRIELKELPFLKEKLVQEEQVLMLNS